MKKHEAKDIIEAIENWLKRNENKLAQDLSARLKEKEDNVSISAESELVKIVLTIKLK